MDAKFSARISAAASAAATRASEYLTPFVRSLAVQRGWDPAVAGVLSAHVDEMGTVDVYAPPEAAAAARELESGGYAGSPRPVAYSVRHEGALRVPSPGGGGEVGADRVFLHFLRIELAARGVRL